MEVHRGEGVLKTADELVPTVSNIRKIAFLGDYLPRKCGIATFTTDLLGAVAAEYPENHCFAVPVNDDKRGYQVPPAKIDLIPHGIPDIPFVDPNDYPLSSDENRQLQPRQSEAHQRHVAPGPHARVDSTVQCRERRARRQD